MDNPLPERIHEVLQAAINENEEDASILTGWVLAFEIMSEKGRPMAGYFIGPATSPWKALGLMEWADKLVNHKHFTQSTDAEEE